MIARLILFSRMDDSFRRHRRCLRSSLEGPSLDIQFAIYTGGGALVFLAALIPIMRIVRSPIDKEEVSEQWLTEQKRTRDE
jgi:hypothetical protein